MPVLLDRGVDTGIALTLIVVPLIFAGRQPIGQLVLTCFACWIALCWALRQAVSPRAIRWCGLEPLFVLGITFIGLQLAVLSPNVTQQLSPGLPELLPIWTTTPLTVAEATPAESTAASTAEAAVNVVTPEQLQSGWNRLSLSPSETLSCLVSILGVVMIFWIALQRMRTRNDAFRMISIVAVAASVTAVFGVVQFATTNGKFFWIYSHPYTTTLLEAKAGFTNANHFAGFLALAAGPVAFVALMSMLGLNDRSEEKAESFGESSVDRFRKVTIAAAWLAMAIIVVATILSKSRGGIALIGVAGFMFGFVILRKALLPGKQIVAAIVGLVLVASCVVMFGDSVLHDNTEGMMAGGLNELDEGSHRANVWSANWRMAQAFPYFGIGLGAHRDVIPAYTSTGNEEMVYSHAENSYINVMSETGFIGLGIASLILLVVLSWCLRGLMASNRKDVSLGLAAVLAALAVNMVHAVYDFVWYVPGVMVSLAVLAACGYRLFQSATTDHRKHESHGGSDVHSFSTSRIPGVIRIAAVGGLSVWMVSAQLPAAQAEPYWIGYLRVALRPADPDLTEAEARVQSLHKLKLIAGVVKRNPQNAQAQLRLSRGYLQLFEMLQAKADNQLTVPQLRETVATGGFESWEAIDEWLNLDGVIGKNRKVLDASLNRAYRGIKLSPAMGEGYLYLAELGFVANQSDKTRKAMLSQALKVRPYLAQAHFLVGRDFWQQGDEEQGLFHWKRAFQLSGSYRDQITAMLSPSLSAEKMVELFEPDRNDLRAMREFYPKVNGEENFLYLGQMYARACEQAAETAGREARFYDLREAFSGYNELGDTANAERVIQSALVNNEFDIRWRRMFGIWLHSQQRYDEAKIHLVWCLERQPNDEEIARLANETVTATLDMQTAQPFDEFETQRR